MEVGLEDYIRVIMNREASSLKWVGELGVFKGHRKGG